VQKIFAGRIFCYQISTNNKDGEPEKGLNVRWDKINGSKSHCQSKQGKRKN
jgi:hypothetical protein